ncbi:hypothetical protein CR103_03070 [Massilia psychrophila]|uniref:LysR substrate-binding domain-containing protein n=1 Tax=Massilia psychrophila TaxID=1603353 RepID=A0A2G8T509_9BURK|nr:hypothetical protein CR103_03070 [Massilia psychrophila]GGE66525.1 hypothetical protein GCM10008020_08570 [Massilia psychrophila]
MVTAGRFRFGASTVALAATLLPLYAQTMPDVVLDVTLADHTIDLVEEGFDVGLQKFDASMIARRLATSKVVLCASPATPADVSGHDCLNFAFEQLRHHWPVHWENQVLNAPIVSRMVSNSGAVLRLAALAGMGIMLRSSFTLENDLESGRLVQLLQGHHLGQLSVMMVYPSRRLLSAKVCSFVGFLNAQFPHPESDPWLAGD